MNVVPGIKLALRTLRRDPDGVLPLYLAGAAVPLFGQSVLLAGLAVAYALLAAAGRIDAFVAAVSEVDLAGMDPVNPDPATTEQLADALSILVTPGTLAVAAVAALVALALAVVAGAVVSAGQLHAVRAALDRERALPAGVTGASRDLWRFVRLALLTWLLYLVPLALAAFLVAGAAAVNALLAVLVVLAVLALVVPALVAVYVAVLFAPQAIVVDDVGAVRAVRNNVGFVRANPWTAAGYAALTVAASLAVGAAGGAAVLVSVPQFVPLVTLVVVTPFLGLVGTAIYLDPEFEAREADPAADALPPAGDRLRAAWRRAFRTTGGFVRAHLGLVVVSLALFGVGGVGGWLLTEPLSLPAQTAPEPGEVFGVFPVDDFLNISLNNWRVAVAQTFAGVAAGVPTVVTLLFNGLVVGALAGAGFDPAVFVALIAPHGVVEIPALAVASAVGLSLGVDGWRYARGREDAVTFADSLERAFYVLLALLPVFLFAGFVEAFVTPWVGGLVAG